MNEEKFKVRTYGKSELAMEFFPGSSKETAMKSLREWLRAHPELKDYINPKRHRYSPAQVKRICEVEGKPYEYL